MSTSGGFWPGEAPAGEQEDVHEPETPVADPPGWPTRTPGGDRRRSQRPRSK